MGETANLLLESATLVIGGGLVAMLLAVLVMENWLRAWEQRVPSPLLRLLRRLEVPQQRMDSLDVALAQKSCPECPSVARCRAWIASRRVHGYHYFCPNAALVERLAERRPP
ncbi:MAG TPA: hypothetical protein VFU24_02020 [Burkholderiales bacterium]|nr:hypothetical protein [Burkholderiales bacterium]